MYPKLGYSPRDRRIFYSSLGYIASLLARNGVVPIIAATANRARYREWASRRLPGLIEVYVRCPVSVCIERDPEGLYRAAMRGEVGTLPVYVPRRLDPSGIYLDDRHTIEERFCGWEEYEPPTHPAVTVDTSETEVDACVDAIVAASGLEQ